MAYLVAKTGIVHHHTFHRSTTTQKPPEVVAITGITLFKDVAWYGLHYIFFLLVLWGFLLLIKSEKREIPFVALTD